MQYSMPNVSIICLTNSIYWYATVSICMSYLTHLALINMSENIPLVVSLG